MQVAVACGTLKGGRGDWLVEKVAELGGASLLPLLTDRSPEVRFRFKFQSNLVWEFGNSVKSISNFCFQVNDGRAGRLDRVAQAAAKQCQRTHALQVVPLPNRDQKETRVCHGATGKAP